jgi:hypothetical protein
MSPIQARFRAALELRELMVVMQRQLLIREDPSASEHVIDHRLREWVLRDPTPPRVAEADKPEL